MAQSAESEMIAALEMDLERVESDAGHVSVYGLDGNCIEVRIGVVCAAMRVCGATLT